MEIGGSMLDAKKRLSSCHMESEVSECHSAGVGTREQTEGRKSLKTLRLELIPAKNCGQGLRDVSLVIFRSRSSVPLNLGP